MRSLENQVAIVIGSTSGIGEASARAYAAAGATVVITGRREDRITSIVKSIVDAGGKAEGIPLDAKDIQAGFAAIDKVAGEHRRLDIIHLNSGMNTTAPLGKVSEELWDSAFATNLKGHFFLAQYAVPELVKTKGKILFTSSLGGLKPSLSMTNIPYGLTKAAIDCLVQIMALDLAEQGVRVNGLAPGIILTGMTGGDSPEAIATLTAYGQLDPIPMKRFGHASELADLALFLVSDEAAYITGQVVRCCGGRSIP
jgi:NAD(P)-dependent dehydrogenase (short-subunit alcohol dehydrogenase family)